MRQGRAQDTVLCWAEDNGHINAAVAGMKGYGNVLGKETERDVNFHAFEIKHAFRNK